MIAQLNALTQFVIKAFLHIWPYLLLTVPIAVAVQLTPAGQFINRAFNRRPVAAIFMATAVGAFSPFCSCGVIPVVASLLVGGVPLAPVMSFWIASPSMDPEMFFLSVSMLGWKLAVWRLAATFVISLAAGFVTLFLTQRGLLGKGPHIKIGIDQPPTRKPVGVMAWQFLKRQGQRLGQWVSRLFKPSSLVFLPCCQAVEIFQPLPASLPLISPVSDGQPKEKLSGCSCDAERRGENKPDSFSRRLFNETGRAMMLMLKFMALVFVLEAIIELYIPKQWVTGLLGGRGLWSIFGAALVGVPVYTSNLTALPLVSGLLAQGLNPAAALAFLVSGPTTTLPAMTAVWGLTSRRVFFLYVGFSFFGALAAGLLYQLVQGF